MSEKKKLENKKKFGKISLIISLVSLVICITISSIYFYKYKSIDAMKEQMNIIIWILIFATAFLFFLFLVFWMISKPFKKENYEKLHSGTVWSEDEENDSGLGWIL
jgi:Na+/H+ antiporter NhaC